MLDIVFAIKYPHGNDDLCIDRESVPGNESDLHKLLQKGYSVTLTEPRDRSSWLQGKQS